MGTQRLKGQSRDIWIASSFCGVESKPMARVVSDRVQFSDVRYEPQYVHSFGTTKTTEFY